MKRLGEYDKENECCAVKVTLEEQPAAVATAMPFLQRIKVALEWTIKYYLGLLAILLLMLAVGYATTLLLERLRETANVTRPLAEKKGES